MRLTNDAKSESTIRNVNMFLNSIARHANLDNPEEVLAYIAKAKITTNSKECLCYAYRKYCKYYNIQAKIPFYQPQPKPIKLPTHEKIQTIIASSSPTLATKLTLSLETGVRPIELHNLKVKDVDLELKLIYPITAKHGNPRTLKISPKLATMLQKHIIENNLQPEDKLFTGTPSMYGKNYRGQRNRLAKKLNDPTLKNIRLYDLRHYFCTTKLYDLKNTFTVMQLMGHKRLETTQIYMHYIDLGDPSYTTAAAATKDEALKLIEAGFEYVQDKDGYSLYRKRK